MSDTVGNLDLDMRPHAVTGSSSHEAQFFDTRMGWRQLLYRHVEKRLIRGRLFFADAHTPRIELLVSFEKKDDLSVIGNFVTKFQMLTHVSVELKSQETVTFFKDSQENSPFLSRRCCHGFKTDQRHFLPRGNEV